MAVERDVMNAGLRNKAVTMGPKLDGLSLKQPLFGWNLTNKYAECGNFKLEVNNIFKIYNINQSDNILMLKNWLDGWGLQLIETLTQAEWEACITVGDLFEMQNKTIRPQHNATILSFQYCKLSRCEKEVEWMSRLHVMTVKCVYKEIDRQLKEQFINGLNDDSMILGIIK